MSVVLHQHLSLWIRDLEEAMSAPDSLPSDRNQDLEESLAIYQRAQKLQNIGVAYGMYVRVLCRLTHSLTARRETSQFALAAIFAPIVFAWLDGTATKMKQWADNALRLDNVSAMHVYLANVKVRAREPKRTLLFGDRPVCFVSQCHQLSAGSAMG